MSSDLLDAEASRLWASLECAPVSAYLLREIPDDFVLEAINLEARTLAPGLVNVLGHACTVLYRDQPKIIAVARECMQKKATLSCEVAVRRHDGMEADQLQRMVYVHLPPNRLIIFAAHVTATENLMAALSASEERYRSLLASLPDAVLVRGKDERVLTCNDVAVALFGHDAAASILGQFDVLAPGVEVRDENGEPIEPERLPSRHVIRTGKPVRGELYRVLRPGDGPSFVRVSAEPVRTRAGDVGGSVTLFIDETERIAAQRAEREAATRLELALEAASMGVWEWEPGAESDCGTCSPSLARLFDVTGSPSGFTGLLTRVHPEDKEGILGWTRAVLQRADGQTSEHEFRIIGNDGMVRWARARGRSEQGLGRARVIGTLADTTTRRQVENTLRESRHLQSVGRLAGGVAHDFNNLLTAMLGSLEMLADICPPAGREDLATVRQGAERARDLTAQLLAFARKQPIVLEVVDLGQLLARVERLLRPLLGSRITLAIATRPGLNVRADSAQLEQVLVNLAANARDAMPSGGRLELRVGTEVDPARGETVTLDVIDSGPGMAAQTLAHVFDPFFSERDGGANLALASSYGIVKQHGGDISVDSQLGRGTRFRIALPKVAPLTPVPNVGPPPEPRKGCILVVDDEDSVRKTTCRLLKSLGYEVLAAEDGRVALELAASHPGPIDVLLCDVAMPGQSGPEVAQRVLEVRRDLRVLFVSGYPEGEENVVSAHGFLQKPYTRASLGEKLASLRERPVPLR